jgi:hypothetical protein
VCEAPGMDKTGAGTITNLHLVLVTRLQTFLWDLKRYKCQYNENIYGLEEHG